MLLTLNTDSLNQLELPIDHYAILLAFSEKKQSLLDRYITDDIKSNLFNKGLIEDVEKCELTEKAKNIIFGDNLFNEFIVEFPQKVTRTDGTVDFLRTDLANAENLYLSYVGRSRDKHNHILKCLKAEIKQREGNGSMPYMMRVFKWLANKGWSSYEDIVDEVLTSKKDLGYGTTLI